MRCPFCFCKIERDASFCSHCGQRIEESDAKNTDENKSIYLTNVQQRFLIYFSIFIAFVFYFFVLSCSAGICLMPKGIKTDYCIIHRCSIDDCSNKKAKDNNLCYTHLPSDSYNYVEERAENVLDFSDVYVSQNSSYTVCTGTITNNGNRTYTFIEIKGKFKDSSGKVLDTDWTYAVGSEGLAPGESSSFRMSVKKNTSIRKCDIEIIDYDR